MNFTILRGHHFLCEESSCSENNVNTAAKQTEIELKPSNGGAVHKSVEANSHDNNPDVFSPAKLFSQTMMHITTDVVESDYPSKLRYTSRSK